MGEIKLSSASSLVFSPQISTNGILSTGEKRNVAPDKKILWLNTADQLVIGSVEVFEPQNHRQIE
jgi:hypothetical protein